MISLGFFSPPYGIAGKTDRDAQANAPLLGPPQSCGPGGLVGISLSMGSAPGFLTSQTVMANSFLILSLARQYR